MNAFAACMNIDRLHERVDSLHECVDSLHEHLQRVDRLHEGVISLHEGLHEHATTGWAGKEGQLWVCCNG